MTPLSPAATSLSLAQVRRSSYHDVVRLQDISKLADVSGECAPDVGQRARRRGRAGGVHACAARPAARPSAHPLQSTLFQPRCRFPAAGIQSYTINGARVLFLRRRPQPRPPKGAVGASQCTICSRHLQACEMHHVDALWGAGRGGR